MLSSLSSSLWESPLRCDLFRKKKSPEKFPFTATITELYLLFAGL